MDNIEVGDIVRLKSGNAPLEVIAFLGNDIQARYLSDRHGHYEPITRSRNRFVLHENFPKEEIMTTPTLYQTKDGKFGTELARNSEGKIVLELKGTGDVIAIDPSDLTEVRPYTVNVAGGHYEAPKGVLKKGDLLILNGRVEPVHEIDTGCRKAQGPLPANTRRVVTAPLFEEEQVIE